MSHFTQFYKKTKPTVNLLKIISDVVADNVNEIFGRDTTLVDKDVLKNVLANPRNKKKLLAKLKEERDGNNSFSISLNGEELSFENIVDK